MVSFYSIIFIFIFLICVLLAFDIYLLIELENIKQTVDTIDEAIDTNARIIYDSNLDR
jgi:TM2 domain-containing membrane protein YozV